MNWQQLLEREPIAFDHSLAVRALAGKCVLVTGAGGSIGSELVRQLVQLGAAQVIALERHENSLYALLREESTNHTVVPVLASVGDAGRLRRVFACHRPQVVFHAAAHKHVDLTERCPDEAVRNNVLGTKQVIEAAVEAHCAQVVLVSSDKAVSPVGIMGATKRLGELMMLAQPHSATRFSTVRFGNVLGSAGSVVPLFKKQIAQGGPVTVTDLRMTRYLMTIPEAVGLLLLATGSATASDVVYVLNMGQPVRILDLARRMIALAGKTKEVAIVETGIRPGEKLYESLLNAGQTLLKTESPYILAQKQQPIQRTVLWAGLQRLEELLAYASDAEISTALFAVIAAAEAEDEPTSSTP